MMRTTSRFSKKAIVIFSFFLFIANFCFSDNDKWTIAVQKFTYAKGQTENAVTNATAETLPSDILEKINKTLVRNVYPDEKLERTRYKLRTERQSLYLQLSSEYKKRDSLFLNDYSTSKLAKSIKDEEKKIEEIKKKIDDNLKELKNQENLLEDRMEQALSGEYENPEEDTELRRVSRLFKRIFVKEEAILSSENITFYKNDITALYTPSAEDMENGYLSYGFEKSIYGAGINTLLTGSISSFGDYISVSVDMYLYPGAKKVASVMEIGSKDDMDLITTSLANQLVPYLTNSMPVDVSFEINPKEAAASDIFIDDVLQKTDGKKIILRSGIHTIQFVREGYKTAETSYYFEGNKKYKIDVEMVELKDGLVNIEVKNLLAGDIYLNGRQSDRIDENHTQIKINGNQILGEFIAENGETAFFYIPVQDNYDGSYVTINPKPFDRDKYIDSRRRWMYGAYSAFMVSLIPYFYTYGNIVNKAELYNSGQMSYEEANRWQVANNICSGITIGCGIFWGYELVRYFMAANSVIPEKAKKPKKNKKVTESEDE